MVATSLVKDIAIVASRSCRVSIFLAAWTGYSRFAKMMAVRRETLSSVMRIHREGWMWRVAGPENPV
ncbi:MAG: hypothetical protein DRR42_04500 [Gammaproteobacteria bacterium]|nr:MAG: hypothetical protein DRR42_04500 [Gammaproteobacteria bacterium]